ncbi:MAG: tetratricopeptide repeat protein, partial [Candidatus Polarisedimenticolia bacterium]
MGLDRTKVALNAEKHLRAGKLPEAIAEFRKLADDNPRDMNIVNKLGDLCVRAGKNQDAMRYFLRIAEFYAADGFYLKAIAMYKKVTKLDPANMDCLQKLASLYQQQGLTIEARAQYQAVAEQFVKTSQFKKAAEAYSKILESEPDNIKVLVTVADLHVRAGSPADAVREYRLVAQELARKGMFDEALKVVQKGIRSIPNNPDLMSLMLSLSKEAEKSPGDLLATVEQMAKSTGDNPRSLALLGEAYLAAGKSADADKVFKRLTAMADGAPTEVAAAVGRYHVARNQRDRAFEWLARAAEEFAANGRHADALHLLAELLRAFPDSAPALRKQAEIAEQAGDRKIRIEALEALAGLLTEAGESEEAVEVATLLQSIDPENPRHAKRLAGLQAGGASAPRPGAPAAPAARPAPPPVPAAVPDIQDGALDLEGSPGIELGVDDVEAESGDAGTGEDEETYGTDSRIQDLSDTDDSGEPEDEDFVNEHFTEAEVFVKYGLLDKAKEQLQKILARYPRHVPSHAKLKEIYYEEGDKEKAVAAGLALAEILKGKGRREESQDMINEAIRIDPNNPRIKALSGAAAEPPPAGAKSPARAPAPPPPGPPKA